MRELAIDRAIYLVDEDTRTYRFVRRNPGPLPDAETSNRHKRELLGYTRVMSDGTTKPFRFVASRSRHV